MHTSSSSRCVIIIQTTLDAKSKCAVITRKLTKKVMTEAQMVGMIALGKHKISYILGKHRISYILQERELAQYARNTAWMG